MGGTLFFYFVLPGTYERWMEMFFFSFSRRVGWVLHYITIVLGAVKKPLL